MWLISRNIIVWTMNDMCKDEKGFSVNYFNECCVLVEGLLALHRSLISIVNANILVFSLSLCIFMLHDRLIWIMETNLFSLPIKEPIDSQKIRMTGFVPVISRKGRRRALLLILLVLYMWTWNVLCFSFQTTKIGFFVLQVKKEIQIKKLHVIINSCFMVCFYT